jgi:DNA-binding response OmpR family regulator
MTMGRARSQRTILVLEHDTALREGIVSILQAEGFIALPLSEDALTQDIAQYMPLSLLLLDSTLLQQGGIELCQALRERSQTTHVPILMMVSHESEITQLMRSALHIDDFIMKPLLWDELRACVKTLLRVGNKHDRKHPVPRRKITQQERQVLIADDLYIDVAHHQILRSNQQIELGHPLLFDLLAYMVRHRGIVLTRDHLLRQVWGYEQVNDTRTVDVHMHWLREKLEDDPSRPQLIQTIRGLGYRFKA